VCARRPLTRSMRRILEYRRLSPEIGSRDDTFRPSGRRSVPKRMRSAYFEEECTRAVRVDGPARVCGRYASICRLVARRAAGRDMQVFGRSLRSERRRRLCRDDGRYAVPLSKAGRVADGGSDETPSRDVRQFFLAVIVRVDDSKMRWESAVWNMTGRANCRIPGRWERTARRRCEAGRH